VLEERNGVRGRHVLAEDDNPGTRVVLMNPARCLDALVRAGRRHPDIGDHDIWKPLGHDGQELWQVRGHPD
jgi:hypothetical protein